MSSTIFERIRERKEEKKRKSHRQQFIIPRSPRATPLKIINCKDFNNITKELFNHCDALCMLTKFMGASHTLERELYISSTFLF